MKMKIKLIRKYNGYLKSLWLLKNQKLRGRLKLKTKNKLTIMMKWRKEHGPKGTNNNLKVATQKNKTKIHTLININGNRKKMILNIQTKKNKKNWLSRTKSSYNLTNSKKHNNI